MNARSLRAALAAPLLATALAVGAAFQVALPVGIGMGPGLLSSRLAREFHDAEAGYRWSRETSFVRLPGPGRGRRLLVDVTLSAWRPRGQPLPEAILGADGSQRAAVTTPRPGTVRIETESLSAWSGAVQLFVASPTARPGRSDPRRVGVRVHEVRLSAPSMFSPGLPPLRALALSLLLTAAVTATALRRRTSLRTARAAGLACASALGLAHLFARAYAFVLLSPAVIVALAAVALVPVAPAFVRVVAQTAEAAIRRVGTGARVLALWPAASIALAALLGTAAAYAARPALDLDLGSGREEPYARGLLAYDAEGSVTFRHAAPGAALDLADLGGGARWRVDVVSSSTGPATVTAGTSAGALRPEWAAAALDVEPRWGWRPGPRLEFTGEGGIRIDRVRIHRGRSLPSPRVALAVAAAGLLMAIAFGAAGCGRTSMAAAGIVVVAAAAAALAADPLLATPLAPRFAAVVGAGALLAALAAAVNERTGAALPAAALAACAAGFVAWLAAPLTPLYRGGHFVFHSSIAEEIWHGRLLHYALPYPGSMLSQQAQWGNVVVPHPCLFHVVAAPLAALPRPWFHSAVKGLLAAWLAGMAAVAALLAGRLGGARAAVYAAVALAATPATFQLIGLGHLMTVFGCFAMAVAMAFVALRFERMREKATFWSAVALLTVCYLSYTAALLFTVVLLALALPFLHRRWPEATRAVSLAATAAAAAAFAVYYVYWAWPFVTDSLPRLLLERPGADTAGSGRALWPRLLAQPRKLAYTFGTPLVPLAGIAGLVAAARGRAAVAALLVAWAAVLPLFIGTDLFFNFLLKHHYFAVVPVAVGIGVLLARLAERPGGRWVAGALLAAMAVLAGRVAMAVATGRIP